jgi:predicted adenine nucleotide alpha hydrolase (AANH) superfamily ATPase
MDNADRFSKKRKLYKKCGCIYSVPYVEDNEKIFLKTIIPNSKATKKYFGGKK